MANDKMLETAEAEVERLQTELEKTPAYKRLMAAKELIATYRGNPEVSASPAAPAKFTPTEFANMAVTKTAQVEIAAAEYLAHRGRRATSGELLPPVQAKGITITGKMPSKTLSSYLSNSKRFDNVPGFGGYGLTEWGGRRTAPAPAPAGTPNEIIHDSGKLPLNS